MSAILRNFIIVIVIIFIMIFMTAEFKNEKLIKIQDNIRNFCTPFILILAFTAPISGLIMSGYMNTGVNAETILGWWFVILGFCLGFLYQLLYLIFKLRFKIPEKDKPNYLPSMGIGLLLGIMGFFLLNHSIQETKRIEEAKNPHGLTIIEHDCDKTELANSFYKNIEIGDKVLDDRKNDIKVRIEDIDGDLIRLKVNEKFFIVDVKDNEVTNITNEESNVFNLKRGEYKILIIKKTYKEYNNTVEGIFIEFYYN